MNHTSLKSRHHPGHSGRRPISLRTLVARVRSAELTPLGHVSVVLDTPDGPLNALSDAAAVHLGALIPGADVEVVLLSLRRATPDATWHWQLLCCRVASTPGIPSDSQIDGDLA